MSTELHRSPRTQGVEHSDRGEPPRLIALYLPQYHPIPENDAWWGKGFTEWTNVSRAKPLFAGHYQPHLPADLGFYDLRLPEARAAQAELARAYGIHGFCYYHYWFNGRRLLERPFNEVLASGEPEFPFCLCWANEPWSRRWDGMEQEVLMPQSYSAEDDLAHIRWLLEAFEDRRYIRVEGRPLFLVYRANHMPEPARTVERWREEADRLGVAQPFLGLVQAFMSERETDPRDLGFDAAIEFMPRWGDSMPRLHRWIGRRHKWLGRLGLMDLTEAKREAEAFTRNRVYSYPRMVEAALARPEPDYEQFRCVTPSWDNSARRREGAAIFLDSSPELYRRWLIEILRQTTAKAPERRVVFINAWNEWGEGNHLEPCQRWGHAYLEATRSALESVGVSSQIVPAGLPGQSVGG